jgi:CBS domain-containing protein
MRVRDIMTHVVQTLVAGTPITEASETMRASHIRHIPVTAPSGALLGMVSLGDVRQAALSSVAGHLVAFERRNHLAHAPVEQVMHQPLHITSPDALVQDVAGVMRRLKVGCLPVVEDGVLVGIVSEVDVLRIVEQLPSDRLEGVNARHG